MFWIPWITPKKTIPRDFSILILFSFDLQFSISISKILKNSKFITCLKQKIKLNQKLKFLGCCFISEVQRILKLVFFFVVTRKVSDFNSLYVKKSNFTGEAKKQIKMKKKSVSVVCKSNKECVNSL